MLKKLLIAAAASMVAMTASAEEIIRISGIPDENPTELQRKYKPMIDHLEKKLGVKVVYVPVIDYGAVVSALGSGKIDFAWLGGFSFVQAKVMTGATPVVMRDIDRQFKSVFISNTGSGINKPDDLKGKTFAFGAKSSTSGHLFPRYYLDKNYAINPERDFGSAPMYSGAHDSTVKLVESGKIQAGALNAEVWNRLVDSKKVDQAKVKVIWTTPEFVDYTWSARKGMPPAMTKKFADAFLTLNANNPADKAVLDLQGAKKFVTANPNDFDLIEQVGRSTGLLK
ncbi:MAG: putative selenate ABC transporter substrate-binding protein [Telluria sp.]